jgi:chromosome segregation ATPase
VAVPAKGAAELAVVERTPVEQELTIADPRVGEAAALWLTGPAASDPKNAQLKTALALSADLNKLDTQIANSEREQAEVSAATSEARKNLKAIEKLASAKDLRTRLFERLKQLDARGAELTTQLIETRTKRAELEVRVNEALDQVTLDF